jgi:hypothetical protein
MPFALASVLRLRPFVYHLTSVDNLDSIRSDACLKCAADFIADADSRHLLRKRRLEDIALREKTKSVRLQSQSRLHFGNIAFQGGWNLEDLVMRLNGLVYFWPGTLAGPNHYGRNHFASSSWGIRPAAIRICTKDLLESNPGATPLFCRFNSGSPRCVQGRKSPRGPETFLPAKQFEGSPGTVAEITFPGNVRLPDGAEVGNSPHGPWQPLVRME